jgi:type IV pilus assembly protein PilY1
LSGWERKHSLTPGCANTLSDVALYYYKTDLRDPSLQNSAGFNGVDVSKNNVATTDRDPADWQHMVTYTVGLADGLMTWQKDYDTAEAGDFFNIKSGATGCFWSGTGICNWPTPIEDKPPVLDDLWHAAVNSHARYFHASDPGSLADALAGSLAGIKTTPGAASAAATSAPILNETDNSIFTTGYVTGDWTGELFAKTVKVVDGNLQITPKWQAHELLDATDAATRNILTFDTATADKIKPFTYDRLSATERQWVANVCVAPAKLSQCGTLSANEQATLNNGQTIVSFLRGSKANAGKIVRERKHVLGDIVDSTPAFVSAPAFKFADAVTPSYGKFKTDQASRQKMLYVGANDGMLHAFNADTGVEVWAYVPRMLIPKMHLLADVNYARNHTFFVDGAPAVMDAFFGDTWHTVLVGGLNAGGRGFYALDVTVPSAPHALWEFCSDSTCEISDPDLGLSFGNPIITKRNGEPVVLLTSGYNNISPGSGQEILYVVNLASGRFEKVTTGSGTIENPGGLAKISAWADNFQSDNTTQYVYGGDLAGNVWRFDLTSSQTSVMPLATLSDANGKPQPVTTRPELGFVKNQRVVYIGTGRLLGLTDVPDLSQQTLYAFKDTGAPLGNLRTSNKLAKQTLNARDENTRTAVGTAVDWTSQNGWFVDFNPGNTSPGERVNIDPQLTLGTLTVHTNVPLADPCSVGGESWLYQFAYDTGLYVATAPGQIVGQRLPGSTIVGFMIIGVPGLGVKEFATDALRRNPIIPVPVANGPAMGRRIGWREITR